jgi:hypothetical protein
MDLGGALVRMTGFTAGLSPPMLGRWFALLAQGRMQERTILDEPPVRWEVPIALVTHYAIGVTLALVFGLVLKALRIEPRPFGGFALALVFAALTNLLPWLWMFPSMGFGNFGSAGPPELLLFRSSLVNHLIYGLGLGASTCVLGIWGAGVVARGAARLTAEDPSPRRAWLVESREWEPSRTTGSDRGRSAG